MTEDNDEAWTRVELSFYKPQGYIDVWYVETADRGLAVRSAFAVYGKNRMAYLNYVNAVTGPRPDRNVLERCYLEVLDEEGS